MHFWFLKLNCRISSKMQRIFLFSIFIAFALAKSESISFLIYTYQSFRLNLARSEQKQQLENVDQQVAQQDQSQRQAIVHICPKNEFYNRCGRVCERTCATIHILDPLCVLSCNPAQCTCKDGYVRHGLHCVRPELCKYNITHGETVIHFMRAKK